VGVTVKRPEIGFGHLIVLSWGLESRVQCLASPAPPIEIRNSNGAGGDSKRSQRRGARRSMSGGVLFLYVDAKSVERNEAYEAFSIVTYGFTPQIRA
jgi:hypothetical protein